MFYLNRLLFEVSLQCAVPHHLLAIILEVSFDWRCDERLRCDPNHAWVKPKILHLHAVILLKVFQQNNFILLVTMLSDRFQLHH